MAEVTPSNEDRDVREAREARAAHEAAGDPDAGPAAAPMHRTEATGTAIGEGTVGRTGAGAHAGTPTGAGEGVGTGAGAGTGRVTEAGTRTATGAGTPVGAGESTGTGTGTGAPGGSAAFGREAGVGRETGAGREAGVGRETGGAGAGTAGPASAGPGATGTESAGTGTPGPGTGTPGAAHGPVSGSSLIGGRAGSASDEALTGGAGAHHAAHEQGGRPHGARSPLLAHEATEKFSAQLHHAVGGFVDAPRAAVEEADHVLEEVADLVADALNRRRRDLRAAWQSGDGNDSDTERLRVALRDYREFAERLLHV
ncbi:hypothetical protein [Streptomyces sp. MH192]|uniref:hypothetical protein n=1 Tax=unclassified Streptomyces TaxID=2593676 RepID=UPI001F1D2B1D|nr:hypothetical protein [Streptomyces sp. MH192]MCF0086268.1 hypothetical protein [Streptomyces sp. MH192]